MMRLCVLVSLLSMLMASGKQVTVPADWPLQSHISGSGAPIEDKYLSKFVFNPGPGSVTLDVPRTILDRKARMLLFSDEVWEQVRNLDCKAKRDFERTAGRGVRDIPLDSNVFTKETGDGFVTYTANIHHHIRPYFYYLVLLRCTDQIDGEHSGSWHPQDVEFIAALKGKDVRITFVNGRVDDPEYPVTHFSGDESGMFLWTLFCFTLCTAGGYFVLQELRCHKRRSNSLLRGHFHPSIEAMIAAATMHYMSMFCQIIHYVAYSSNGIGWRWLPFQNSAILLHEATKLLLTSLFIVISQGWTITTDTLPRSGTLFWIVGSNFGFELVGLVMQSLYADSHDSYSSRAKEGIIGAGLVLLQVAMYAWFLRGVTTCINEESGRVSVRLRFFKSFAYACSVWFLAEPALVLLGALLANYYRQRVLVGGALLVQTITLGALSWLFLSRSTSYSKISTVGQSHSLLPSGMGGQPSSSIA